MDKFGQKNSKLFILTQNCHKWYIEDADSYSDNSFKFIFGQILAEKVKVKDTHIHTQFVEDVDSYFDISFLKFQTLILRMLILILRLVF